MKVALPKTGGAGQTLALPGTLQGFVQSPIAARASGYLRRWYKDIGSRVEKGELLAEIETPEIDQQLSQAIAARAAGRVEPRPRAKSTVERWESLRKKDAVSQQELDERRSGDAQARANLAAADANVERLRQLEGFKRDRRAVRRRDHAAQRRRRRPDRRRRQRRARAVPARADRSAARLRQRAADLRAAGEAGPEGRRDAGRAARPHVQRRSRAHVGLDRRGHAHDADRGGAAQPRRHAAARRVRAGRAAARRPATALTIPDQRAAVPRRRHRASPSSTTQGRVHLRPFSIGRNYGETVEVLDGVTRQRPAGAESVRLARRRRRGDDRARGRPKAANAVGKDAQ